MDFANYWFSSGAGGGGYEIGESLRFRRSQYLSRSTGNVTPSNNKIFSLSCWVKYNPNSQLGGPGDRYIWAATASNTYNWACGIGGNGGPNRWQMGAYPGSPSTFYTSLTSNASFRDPGAWFHMFIRWDTTQATASNRVRVWINGVEMTFWTGTVVRYPDQNSVCPWNDGQSRTQRIGYANFFNGIQNQFDGYIAEAYNIDGQALSPTDFGEFNSDSVWVPIAYTGSYGNLGFYLDFSDPANIGTDRSGRGNNFTPTGFELSNTTSTNYDSMLDSPTQNVSAWNPLYPDVDMNPTYSNGNMLVTTQGFGMVLPTTGKWYWETKSITNYGQTGLIKNSVGGTSSSFYSEQRSYYDGGYKYNGTVSSYGASWTTNDVIGVAVDAGAGTITMYKNGSSQGTMFSDINATTSPTGWRIFAAQMELNSGKKAFAYTPPAGYEPLSTAELPDAAITDPSEHFAEILYTGNGTTLNVTGVGFAPDFVWIKNRFANRNYQMFDTSRGVGKTLYSNLYDAESTNQSGGYLSAFGSDGFTVTGGVGDVNATNDSYVAWCWKKSAAAGFDIVTWSGNGVTGRQIPHSLGVKPAWVLLMARTRPANYNHYVWHQALNNPSGDTWLRHDLNSSQETGNGNGPFSSGGSNSNFNSTGFSVANEGNNGSSTYVALVWSEVPGFSSFGSYVGTQNSNGPFYYCGFRPAWVCVKSRTNQGEWYVHGNKRSPYNPSSYILRTNNTDQDSNNSGFYEMDILSNGFKIRTSNTSINQSGQTYIVMAFAEHPFGGANVSPSPAR